MINLRIAKQILALLALSLFPQVSLAIAYSVTSSADDGSVGTLRSVINQLNASGTSGSSASNNTINFNAGLGTITLTSNLPVLQNGVNIIAPTAGQTISGNNLYRLFATYKASLGLANLTLSQGLSQGGAGVSGGGGGMGAGGAVYVDLGQTLSMTSVTMQNCFAKGGAGAAVGVSGGGGGGASWSIGSTVGTAVKGGGDYPGNGAAGGAAAYAGSLPGYGGGDGGAGAGTGGNAGGTGAGVNASTSNGGDGGYCGGGGGGSDTTNNSAGGGGGNGGGNGNTGIYSGGGGGGYGSGGAGAVGAANFAGGGGGGFGGGGGGGSLVSGFGAESGGGGGFGGGGGSGSAAGFGGHFGGDGVANNVGGGGAGIGGAVFVGDGAILQIGNSVTSTSNSTTAGSGGNLGTAYANDVFLFRGAALQFVNTSNFTSSFAIQADTNALLGHLDAGVLVNTTNNAIVTFNSNSSNYQGGTSIQAGGLIVATGNLPTTGAVNIGANGTLAFLTDSVATVGAFSNAGALNLFAQFTPTHYTSFANTSTGKVYVVGSGSIASNVATIGSLSIGQNSLGATNVNNLSISNAISFDDINVYNTSTLATTGAGSVTGRLYMLSTSTFSGNNISGSSLTTGQDSFGNSVAGSAFAASQAISSFPTINVKTGTFTTNGFAMSNVNTAFNISSGATATFNAIVNGTAALVIDGTLNNSIVNGMALTGLVTINGTLNVLQNLTLGNTVNCAGNIAVSSGKSLTSNSTLFVYNNAILSGDISGGGASSLVIGLDSLSNPYSTTKATINSNVSNMPTLTVANGTLTANGTISGVNTSFSVANGATGVFNGAVTGNVAATNAGTFKTSAAVAVTSYASTGTTQFVVTDASTTGSITTVGAANFGTTPIVVTSNFITPLPGVIYPWTLVTAAPLAALANPPTLPANTVANIWSYTTSGTQFKIELQKFQLRATTPVMGSVINAMSVNPTNLKQFILINALGDALSQTELDNNVKQLIPELNSSLVNVMKQDAVFRQVGHRITAVRENYAYNGHTGFVAGDMGNNKAVWIGPFGSIADQGPTANNLGYKAYSGGLTLGFDIQLNDRTLLGIAGAYSSTSIQTKLNGGLRTRTLGYHTLVYGSHVLATNDARYVEWMASLGLNRNHGVRRILISGYDFTTNSKYNNVQSGLLVNYGKNYKYKSWWTFTPLATAQYSLINTPPYSETTSSPAALYVKNNRLRNVFTLGLGGKTTIKAVTPKLSSRYTLGAIVAYDLISTKQVTNTSFLSGSSTFTFASSPSRFGVNLDAGCDLDLTSDAQLQFGYELQLRQGYISNAVTAKFKYLL